MFHRVLAFIASKCDDKDMMPFHDQLVTRSCTNKKYFGQVEKSTSAVSEFHSSLSVGTIMAESTPGGHPSREKKNFNFSRFKPIEFNIFFFSY